jgi:hypothetical protein
MKMNTQTKLIFALEHVAHLYDLIEDNEWEQYLTGALSTLEYELERQLANELHRKLGDRIQGTSNKEVIKEGVGIIGRIED